MKRIGGIILAAGGAHRFGEPKQLLDWGGVPLVAHIADEALIAGLDPVIVVLGHRAEAVRAALGTRPIRSATNWRWEEGLSTSVLAGLSALPPDTEAAILMVCDQPLLTAGLLQALVARFQETDAAIVYPVHAGRRGTPTLFARRLFPELAAVEGDVGGRAVIAAHPDEAAAVEIDDADVLADIDTPADYARLKPRAQRAKPDLQHVRHLIIDMDGVLWRGDEPMQGLASFFDLLREREIGFVLATNNSSRTPEQYTAKLARFSVHVPAARILTSSQVTAAYLADQAPGGGRVYVIGSAGLCQALAERGFVTASEDVDYVVVGWDTRLTWDKLETAALLIQQGAGFIGTNPDTNFPTPQGLAPGNGAQLAALEVTTGVAPIVTGKPEAPMYEEAMKRTGARPETTAVVGDRLDTDIAGGVRLGLTTVLVLSGISTEAELAHSSIKPDVVCADIGALTQLLQG